MKLTRRQFLRLGVFSLLALLLSSCVPPEEPEENTEGAKAESASRGLLLRRLDGEPFYIWLVEHERHI